MPSLEPEYVVNRIYKAIINEEEEVYIWWFIIYIKMILDWMPERIRRYAVARLIGDGMKTFTGRAVEAKKKNE